MFGRTFYHGTVRKYVITAKNIPIKPSVIKTALHPNKGPNTEAIIKPTPTPSGIPR